jgi:polar amino acid transport system ATP-binding protein
MTVPGSILVPDPIIPLAQHAVEFINVSKWYGEFKVLDGVSLRVGQGDKVVVIGPSGSGKTTLIRCINHLEKIDDGQIFVNGDMVGYRPVDGRVVRLSEKEIAFKRRKIGMVFQRFNLFPHLTAIENVCEAPLQVLKLGYDEARARGEALLTRVGLSSKFDSYPSQLSGGQQQRVAIARVLAMRPSLVLFDEPTSALDPEMVGEVLSVMKDLSSTGISMVVVSHEMAFAREVADRMVMMDKGQIIETKTPDAFFDNPEHPRTQDFLAKIL